MATRFPKELWDISDFRLNLEAARTQPVGKNGFAVLVSTGSFNPLHAGHVHMMELARECAERHKYTVLGGWLSASSDGYVEPKMERSEYAGPSGFALPIAVRTTCIDLALRDHRRHCDSVVPSMVPVVAAAAAADGSLSATTRSHLHNRHDKRPPTAAAPASTTHNPAPAATTGVHPSSVCRTATGRPWLAQGYWEGCFDFCHGFGTVCVSLEGYLLASTSVEQFTLFYVCGEDHYRRCNLHRGMGHVGVIVVPRRVGVVDERHAFREPRPDALVLFAQPLTSPLAEASSSFVRRALVDGRPHALASIVHPLQLQHLTGVYAARVRAAVTEGAWPAPHVASRLVDVQGAFDKHSPGRSEPPAPAVSSLDPIDCARQPPAPPSPVPPAQPTLPRSRTLFLSLAAMARCDDPAVLAQGLAVLDCSRDSLPPGPPTMLAAIRAADGEGRVCFLRINGREGAVAGAAEGAGVAVVPVGVASAGAVMSDITSTSTSTSAQHTYLSSAATAAASSLRAMLGGILSGTSTATTTATSTMARSSLATRRAGWGWYWRLACWLAGHLDPVTLSPYALPTLPQTAALLQTAQMPAARRLARYTFVYDDECRLDVLFAFLRVECPTLAVAL